MCATSPTHARIHTCKTLAHLATGHRGAVGEERVVAAEAKAADERAEADVARAEAVQDQSLLRVSEQVWHMHRVLTSASLVSCTQALQPMDTM